MTDQDLTRAESRAHYKRVLRQIEDALEWPHRLRLTCTGRGKHPENTLAEIWVDKTTGVYVLNRSAATRNMHNRLGNKKSDHIEPYIMSRPEEDYKTDDDREMLEAMRSIGKVPSWGADRIRCHRCKLDEQRNIVTLSLIYMECGWANMQTVPVDYLPELLKMLEGAEADREKRKAGRGDERGGRPLKTARKDIWQAYARSKSLNIEGMTKPQIIATVHYYGV